MDKPCDTPCETVEIGYSRKFWLICLAAFLCLVATPWYGIVLGADHPKLALTSAIAWVAVPFGLLGGLVSAFALVRRDRTVIRLTSDGLSYRYMWRETFLRWDLIDRIVIKPGRSGDIFYVISDASMAQLGSEVERGRVPRDLARRLARGGYLMIDEASLKTNDVRLRSVLGRFTTVTGADGSAVSPVIAVVALCCIAFGASAHASFANPLRNDMLSAFADHCYSPLLTAQSARSNIASTGARVDFYDMNPFSDVPPTPGTSVTPGTDRRCEVAFDGSHGAAAADVAVSGLQSEGIRTDAPLPATHATAALPGTTLLAARYLNPARIAVVHTGTRPGPNGTETFLSVERLTPEASAEVGR
ncbi:MAG: hypothetical protein WBA67_15670 [Jannaschia sp.]